MKKSSNKVSNVSLTSKEAAMVKLTISTATNLSVFYVEKFNTRSLYKLLRDEKFLPKESVSKTSSETSEEGKSVVVSFKDTQVLVDVDFDVETKEEEMAIASKQKQASIPTCNYGVVTNFGLIAKQEAYFMEYDDESGRHSMVGAEVHTAEYISQLDKKAAKRARQLAKSKELYKLNVVKELKEINVDVKDLDPELVALIAEQALDLESSPNAFLQNDEQDLVKVVCQRYNPKTDRWYNAKNRNGAPMVEFFPAELLFDYSEEGKIVGMKTMDHGQTAIAHLLESEYDLTAVHNYHYIDKKTNELVFKSIEQRFILSGKVINSDVTIDGDQLVATLPVSNWTVQEIKRARLAPIKPVSVELLMNSDFMMFRTHNIIPNFQFFGFDNLHDIGEGFYLMPSSDETTVADLDEALYQEEIMYGRSVGTKDMSVKDQAKFHIKATKQEDEKLEKIGTQARRIAQTKISSKEAAKEEILKSGLYQWALEHQELTFEARKNAKIQQELNAKFETMASEANDLLEVLAVLKAETGKGFAHPSWTVINAIAKKPKQDSEKAFAAQVEDHIRQNIDMINKGELDIKHIDNELLAEIYAACLKYGKKAKCWINNPEVAVKMRDRVQAFKPVAEKSPRPANGSVKTVDVADYYMSNKVS